MRYTSIIFCSILVLLFAGCGANPQRQGPQETAEAFLTALQFDDYEKAKTYCSEGTAKNLGLMETMSSLGANPMKEQFTIISTKEEGDYATVTYDQGKESGKQLQLRNDDGKWVVVMSKTDFGGSKSSEPDSPSVDLDDDSDAEKTPPGDQYESFRTGKTAMETAEAFVKALNFQDYEAAMRYGSSSTNDILDYQKSMAALGSDKKDSPEKKILRVKEDGDFAKAYYQEAGSKGEKVLKMGKDDHGNWEVIMTKSELNEEK